MNASYKIVLLGAFVLFAAVVGYYIFSGDGSDNPLGDDYAQQDPSADPVDAPPPARPTLDNEPTPPAPEPEPEPEPQPAPIEETIGATTEELPEAPVLDTPVGDGSLALADPADDPVRPGPDPIEEPASEDPIRPTDETEAPTEEPRPGPAPEPADPIEETSDPTAEPEDEPSPRPVPPDPAGIPRTYTVQSGDTFASIAEAFYGEERAWFDIAQANPSVDPKRLQVGQVIVLPNRDADVREREEVQPPAPGNDQNYTVRPGDNLSKIAKKFYGDSEKWDLIYARNRKLIGPRPNALKVGMELVIPQTYEGAE